MRLEFSGCLKQQPSCPPAHAKGKAGRESISSICTRHRKHLAPPTPKCLHWKVNWLGLWRNQSLPKYHLLVMPTESQLRGSQRHLGTLRDCGTRVQQKSGRWQMENRGASGGDTALPAHKITRCTQGYTVNLQPWATWTEPRNSCNTRCVLCLLAE